MIPFARPDITQEEIGAVSVCLSNGWLTSGKLTQEFEQRFAHSVGANHAVAVSSATTAALLLMEAYGISEGAEVIVPALTFSGPAMMAHHLGADVVVADVIAGTSQIDPEDVARKITDKTRMIMPTHFAGECCDLVQLSALTRDRGILLVDDAAHAYPTMNATTGNYVGSGRDTDATFFSFYATKCVTTGEGGMITTSDEELATRLRRLRSHGFSREIADRYTNVQTGWAYDIADHGWKANLNDIASSIGLVQLQRSPQMTARRQEIAARYTEVFSRDGRIVPPHVDANHAAHLYVVEVGNRDQFVRLMGEAGVQCSVHFIPLHMHSYWQHVNGQLELPNAENRFALTASLPIFSAMTDDQVSQVIDTVFATLDALDAQGN